MASSIQPTITLTLSTVGPGSGNSQVRASPTGKYLVSFGSTVCVWNGATGALAARRETECNSAHFSSDAEICFVSDNRLVRWHFASGRESSVAVSAPSIAGWATLVVLYGDSQPPQLLDLASNKKRAIASPTPVREGTIDFEHGIAPAVSRDGKRAALLFAEANESSKVAMHLRVIDTTTGKPVFDVAHYPDYDASPSAQWAMLRKAGATRGTWMTTDDFDLYYGPALAFDARGRLFTHMYDQTRVHDATTGALLDRLADAPGVLAMGQDRLVLVDDGGGSARTIKLAPKLVVERTAPLPAGFNAQHAALGTAVLATTFNHLTLMTYPKLAPLPLADGHDDRVVDGGFSPDGCLVATIDDRRMIVWNAKTGKRLEVLHAEYALAFSPDGKSLAAKTHDGVAIWSVKNLGAAPKKVARTKLNRGATWIGWSSEGAFRMIETDQSGLVRVYEGLEARPLDNLDRKLGDGRIVSCGLSADGKYFAAAFAEDEGWGVWDIRSKKRVFQGAVSGRITFQSSGEAVGCAGSSGIEIVKLADGSAMKKAWAVESFAFAADGAHLVIASSDDVRVVKLGKLAVTEQYIGNDISFVALTPDGGRIAVASRGGLLELWDLAQNQPKTRPRSRA